MIAGKHPNPLLFLSSDELQHATHLAEALQSLKPGSTSIVPETDIATADDLASHKMFGLGVLGGLYLFYKRQPEEESSEYAEVVADQIRTRSEGTYSALARSR